MEEYEGGHSKLQAQEEPEEQPSWDPEKYEADFAKKYPILTKLNKMTEEEQKAWLYKQMATTLPRKQSVSHDFLKNVVTGKLQLYKKM